MTTAHWVASMVAGASCASWLYAMMRSTLLKRLSNMAADCARATHGVGIQVCQGGLQ